MEARNMIGKAARWLSLLLLVGCTGEVVVDDGAPTSSPPRDAGPAPTIDGGSPPATDGGPPPTGCGTAAEMEELALTNAAREAAGVAPLICDPDLTAVARAHSEDMCARDYFSHTNPDGDGPSDRVANAGLSHRGIGENIAAGNASPAATHEQWMNSSGHRANIENGDYTRIGIGYASCSTGWPHLWTQVFARTN